VGKNTSSKKDNRNLMFLSTEELGIDSPKASALGMRDKDPGSPNGTKLTLGEGGIGQQSLIEFAVPHIQPGNIVQDGPQYVQNLRADEYPETALDANDYKKRLRFEELKKTKLEEMCNWKQKDVKGIRKNTYIKDIQRKNEKILTVAEKNELEQLEVYTDRFPLLEMRKSIRKFMILVNMVAFEIINTSIFQTTSISVIMLNSFVMMVDDPTQEPTAFFNFMENMFLALYSIEMVLKILGMGFLFSEEAYLKDSWNILDFVIVVSSYPALFTDPESDEESSFNLSALRSFRVMRPLKTISSIKGLKVLMQALFQAFPMLRETAIILMFFFQIFAIGGTNLMSGNLKNRCISIQTGIIHPDELPLCGGISCPGGYFCGKSNENPNFGVTNFDNVFYSFLCVFQSTTLEGWSDIQMMMQKAFTYSIWIYFLPLVFIGAFFLLNLTLAVINAKFTEAHKEHAVQEQKLKELSMGIGIDDDFDGMGQGKDEMSISQFITARIYAKKMIEFLRMRQAIKRIEQERLSKIKEKQAAIASAKR